MYPVPHNPTPADYPIAAEIDRMIRAELKARTGVPKHPVSVAGISEVIETRNRQIVEAHQQGRVADFLPQLMSGYFQTRVGGALYWMPDDQSQASYLDYCHRLDRFETLFTAAITALADPMLSELMFQKRAFFLQKLDLTQEIHQLCDVARRIRRKAESTPIRSLTSDAQAHEYLMALTPLSADLSHIEARCEALKSDAYLADAIRNLEQEIAAATASISQKRQKASTYLFERANDIYHQFKAAPIAMSSMDLFLKARTVLDHYARMFDTVGDSDRLARIVRFIQTVETTMAKLQEQVDKQKAYETELVKKHQGEIQDAYDRFQEIKAMFADGQLVTESQKKNAGAALRKARDGFIAAGQRVMARDVDRFINATGIGRVPVTKREEFDYRKGFNVLLPITIVLTLILLAMVVL